jgi:putative transposase
MRNSYPTDLSDREWEVIEHFFQTDPKKGGRPSKHSKKEMVNTIFYILRSECAWRLLPHDFPPWQTVYQHFKDWQILRVWEEMNSQLVKKMRLKRGRTEDPTAEIVDSQSVKTTEKGGSKDMMEQRRLKGEKGIFWWIRREIYWEHWLMPPAKKMEKACLSL